MSPTPEEAQRALHDVEARRQETAAAAGWPVAYWIGGGVLVAGLGVLYDLKPDFSRDWGNVITLTLLAIAVLASTRQGSAWFGRPVRARQAPASRWPLAIIGGVLLAFLAVRAGQWEVPHLVAILGVAAGLLMALAGPWWQHRVLTRRAARP
ncbi:hypothetical protein [Symbioplanes lichenis]|uniref:hypothetical protein n=1 Tax=Symbioplanes lichenis TaxID=1629072 RepID=UPI002739E3C5|nr:hypothetical protein [Actinoplanes lichenis]